MTYYDKSYNELSNGRTDFGVVDKQNRVVGYRWRILAVRYVARPDDARGGYILRDGLPTEHLEVDAFPTRNGKHYGASSSNIPCLTQAEAEAIIAKRTAQARKRELKRFA